MCAQLNEKNFHIDVCGRRWLGGGIQLILPLLLSDREVMKQEVLQLSELTGSWQCGGVLLFFYCFTFYLCPALLSSFCGNEHLSIVWPCGAFEWDALHLNISNFQKLPNICFADKNTKIMISYHKRSVIFVSLHLRSVFTVLLLTELAEILRHTLADICNCNSKMFLNDWDVVSSLRRKQMV